LNADLKQRGQKWSIWLQEFAVKKWISGQKPSFLLLFSTFALLPPPISTLYKVEAVFFGFLNPCLGEKYAQKTPPSLPDFRALDDARESKRNS